ncbi:hypothetical protein [Streptacidiphilus sp. PAMC 29251]
MVAVAVEVAVAEPTGFLVAATTAVGVCVGVGVGDGEGAYEAYSPVPVVTSACTWTEPAVVKVKATVVFWPGVGVSVGTVAEGWPGPPSFSEPSDGIVAGPLSTAGTPFTVTPVRVSSVGPPLAMFATTPAGALPVASVTTAMPFSLSAVPSASGIEVAALSGFTWRVAALSPAEQAARMGAVAMMTAATAPRRRLRLTAVTSPQLCDRCGWLAAIRLPSPFVGSARGGPVSSADRNLLRDPLPPPTAPRPGRAKIRSRFGYAFCVRSTSAFAGSVGSCASAPTCGKPVSNWGRSTRQGWLSSPENRSDLRKRPSDMAATVLFWKATEGVPVT